MTVLFRRFLGLIIKYGAIVSLVGSLVCYILLTANIISDWKVLIGAAIGVLLGIVALIFEEKKTIDEIQVKINNLIENSAPKLYSLYHCQKDLQKKLSEIRHGDKIVVYHLALDMFHAWPRIEKMLDETNLFNIELRIVMITCNSQELCQRIPKEVAYWCANAEKSLERIKASLERLKSQRKIYRLIVKQYNEIPYCHGFSLVEPLKISYFSLCRWKNGTYDWGEDNYWKICGDTIDPTLKDVEDIFIGMFQHLWDSSGDPVIEWDL